MVQQKRLTLPAVSFCPGFKPGTVEEVHGHLRDRDRDRPRSYDNLTVFTYFQVGRSGEK